MFLPNTITGKTLDIIGKPLTKIVTELTGRSTGFREVANQYGINPFTPQSQINKIGQLTDVDKFQQSIGLTGSDVLMSFSQLQEVEKSLDVKIDWLN